MKATRACASAASKSSESRAIIASRRSHAASPRGFWTSRKLARAARARVARAGEVEGAVVGVPERDVALRDAEPVADAVELGARLREELAAPLEAAHRLLDEGQQDEALRAARARRPTSVQRSTAFVERRARAGVVAEQVVDLAEDDLGLGAARRVAELLVALERLRRRARGPARAAPRSLAMWPSRRSALASLAASPACSKALRGPSRPRRAPRRGGPM